MNIKRNIIRTSAAALSAAFLMAASASQAANLDNREVGHAAPAATTSINVQGLATGLRNGQVGHFAAKVGSADTGPIHAIYGDTKYSQR